jgi:solute:Na+ symporter, SSS family
MDLSLIPLFTVLVISIGASFFASKKEDDFFLASRSVRWPMLIGTFIGLHVGGGFILGNTDASWSLGPLGSMYGLGLAMGMLILGLGFGARLRTLGIATLPELLEKRFCSPWLKRASSLLAIACLAGILMAQAIGLKKFLVSIGFSNSLIFLAAWGSVVFYTTCGGLLAVIWTDTLQAVVMVGMLVITFCWTLLPHLSEIVKEASTMQVSIDGIGLASFLFPLCYIFVTQDIAQRCFAAKSPQDATKGCLGTAAGLLVLTAIPTACGILGKAMNFSPQHGAIFMQVVQALSPPFVFVIAATAVLLAIISTASAVLLALSSNVVQDMDFGPRKGRMITVLIGALAMLGPCIGDDIIGWLVTCNEMAVGAVFIPILCAVFTKKAALPKEAAWCAFVLGSTGTILCQHFPGSFIGALLPILLSGAGFVVGMAYADKRQEVGKEAAL